jgi:lipoyl-dependent peroxiredoxin
MKRFATAAWQGDIQNGRGEITTQSNALSNAPFTVSTRFEEMVGTNPEELVAAAFASCFSMALAAHFSKSKLTPENIYSDVTVVIDKANEEWKITGIHLNTSARIPDVTNDEFVEAAKKVKGECPIGKLLKGTDITMEARLLPDSIQAVS